MQRREIEQWLVGCDRHAEVIERIVRGRLSDKISRCGIKDRVVPVQNLLVAHSIDALEPRNLLDLAVHEPRIVAPGSVKQLVAFHTNRETLGDVFVIDDAVAEIGKACPSAARDDLLKRIKWVKGAKRQSNFPSGRGVWRGNCNVIGINCKGVIGRDEERRAARGLKTARGDRREFIVRFRIHIIKVTVKPKQVVADLRFESRITAPAFLFRDGAREGVKVKARKYTAPDTAS